MQQMRNGNQTSQTNKGQQRYACGKVMHVDAEVAHDNPRVVLGMFLVNSTPALVLFDSGASHSFITSQFVAQHNLPISPMPRHMLVSLPGGELKAIYKCDNVSLNILGRDIRANMIILDSRGIDVILGMGWLAVCDVVIQCAKSSVLLTSPGNRSSLQQTHHHQQPVS
jgi:hypothetical protein